MVGYVLVTSHPKPETRNGGLASLPEEWEKEPHLQKLPEGHWREGDRDCRHVNLPLAMVLSDHGRDLGEERGGTRANEGPGGVGVRRTTCGAGPEMGLIYIYSSDLLGSLG